VTELFYPCIPVGLFVKLGFDWWQFYQTTLLEVLSYYHSRYYATLGLSEIKLGERTAPSWIGTAKLVASEAGTIPCHYRC